MSKSVLERAKEANAVAIYFELQACGYYSGAEYQEDIVILVEDYEKAVEAGEIDGSIDNNYETSVGELDGKHSDVTGTVYVSFFTEEDLKRDLGESCKDSDFLAYDLFKNNLTKCNELEENFNKYYESINHFVEVKVEVPKDKVNELKKYAEELCKNI